MHYKHVTHYTDTNKVDTLVVLKSAKQCSLINHKINVYMKSATTF